MTDLSPSGEGSVRLVGTAHVSADSAERVERVVTEEQPDIVAVELDEGRYRQLQGETPEDIDPADLLKGSMAFQFLAYWMLSYVQTKLGERFDIEPGADMRAGIDAAEATGAGLALVDRDIQVTIQRFWSRMRLREKLGMVWQLCLGLAGVGSTPDDLEDGDEFDIEELTDQDVVTALLEEFRAFSPGGAEALIDERDAFIAHKLIGLREQGHDVVAVVGAGHQSGIRHYLEEPATLPPISELIGVQRKRVSLPKLLGGLLTVGFLVFFLLLVMAGVGNQLLLKVFLAWFLFNGSFSFVMAKLAGAHWSSAFVGASIAWLTSLNPLLAPGWFAGYIELRYEPVKLSDINTLNEILSDEESPVRDLLDRMRSVALFRVIAVVAMTNIGSIVASLLFPVLVLPFFGPPFDSVNAIYAAMIEGVQNSLDLLLGALQ